MKVKIKENKTPEPKYSDYQLDDMETDRMMVKLLDEILGQLKVLNLSITDADSSGESEFEKAMADLTVAEGYKKEEVPENPLGRSDIPLNKAQSVFRSSEKTYSIGRGYVRVKWGLDAKWTMNLKKNTEQNVSMLTVEQDGIHFTTKKPYLKKHTIRMDMKFVKVDPEGKYMDLPGWHPAMRGIANEHGDLLDTEGKTVATREEQVKLSRAYMKWPKVPQYRREQLEMIEDIIVETLKEMMNET
tara:strand:- start:908 stop:1639 length:732 start_codon:yes stop_codon:yes gene_type:complete